MEFEHGFIVGKFYPPHVGHEHLIRQAAERCARVTVVVAGSSVESIWLGDRVEWLAWTVADQPHVVVTGAMDDHPVDYADPTIWDAHMEIFESVLEEVSTHCPPDAVFTGEDYGDELARRLGATHVRLPRETSGTALRHDLFGNWLDLVESARIGLARRVVVVGAESTGTTTLAHDLATALGAAFVPEFGRAYSSAKLARARQDRATATFDELTWSSEEFTMIAARQQAAIDDAARRSPVVVADTDGLATSIWHERYVGGTHQWSLELAESRRPDVYLLTTHGGVPFDDDGMRDGEHLRGWMTERFEQVLGSTGTNWIALQGSRQERLDMGLAHCSALVNAPLLSAIEERK
jgi:NadR type nicotinamide-nucleotide adenylyltransferase